MSDEVKISSGFPTGSMLKALLVCSAVVVGVMLLILLMVFVFAGAAVGPGEVQWNGRFIFQLAMIFATCIGYLWFLRSRGRSYVTDPGVHISVMFLWMSGSVLWHGPRSLNTLVPFVSLALPGTLWIGAVIAWLRKGKDAKSSASAWGSSRPLDAVLNSREKDNA